MTQIPIIMPQLGESIAEAKIVNFFIKPGDDVELDQDIIEVETNKATMNVSSPCKGKVQALTAKLEESYPVGTILGYLEATAEDAARAGLDSGAIEEETVDSIKSDTGKKFRGGQPSVEPTVRGLPVPAYASGASYMSPRLKARMAELGLHAADLAGVAGSGAAGRVTIQDFEKFIAHLEKHDLAEASTMRVAVADAMRRSWTRPLATVGRRTLVDAMLAHRRKSRPKAGPSLYVLRALAIALSENSAAAGRLVGNKIVLPPAIDVGFAVESGEGVLVPVLRNVDKRPLKELIEPYDELIAMAREGRLPQEATGGSIATVSYFGNFNLTWATPIPLPEQTLVVGMGASRRAPHWSVEKGQFVPVMEADLTCSFDHRVMDGGGAGRLLSRVATLLQSPENL
jgi:pyruvate/2-oxoglutarate dehydrogenase complex dihydrolipoamide acyltransferase (E2) component